MSISLTRKHFLGLAGATIGAAAMAACAGPSTDGAGTALKTLSPPDEWSKIKPASSISFMSSHPGKSRDTEMKLIEPSSQQTRASPSTSSRAAQTTRKWHKSSKPPRQAVKYRTSLSLLTCGGSGTPFRGGPSCQLTIS